MSLASHTSTLFHSSFNLLHVSLIKPHLHIHTTTHIPKQPSKPKHHITHLILQLFPTSSLKHLNHLIPDFLDSQSKFTSVIPQTSTILHLSSIYLHCIKPYTPQTISISRFYTFPKKNRSYPAYVLPLHLGLGQFEHSITLRPVPSVQLLNSTSVSLTRLPHWHVFVFGAGAAAAGVCSWGWGSSRCLLWPMVVERGACIVVIVVAFLCLVVTASYHTHHKPFQFHDFTVGTKNIGWLLRFTGIILKRILFRGESTPRIIYLPVRWRENRG